MWLSASAFFHQYFRVYSPIAFGKKTDKDGEYIRKYLPVLKNFPSEYIYEPWNAPLSVQKHAKCIIGQDYPRPIVDHNVVSKQNIARMKAAYDADPKKDNKGEEEKTTTKAAAKKGGSPKDDEPVTKKSRAVKTEAKQTTLAGFVKKEEHKKK